MSVIILQEKKEEHQGWIKENIIKNWGSEMIAVHGQLFNLCTYPGIIAMYGNEKVGLLIYRLDENGCEVLCLRSYIERIGIGTALLESIKHEAIRYRWSRIWLTTTNDNIKAMQFYQKRGFDMIRFHFNSIADIRNLKPEIPLIGIGGIPIKHEIEFEYIPVMDTDLH